jgi:hypothetical protein
VLDQEQEILVEGAVDARLSRGTLEGERLRVGLQPGVADE